MKANTIKIIRVVLVLGLAVAIAAAFIKFKPKPQKEPPPLPDLLVEVIEVKASSPFTTIKANGTVRPIETLNLIAEVKGKVAEMAPNFEEGDFIRKKELLIRIDPRSYELTVAQRKKQLKQIDAERGRLAQEKENLQTTLKITESDVQLAKADWERFRALVKREVIAQSSLDQAEQKYLASRNRMQEIENQIALMDPRVDQLEAQKELVEVQLREARLDLERTQIKAPFDGWVLEKAVENGQFVTAGSFLGRIYRASALEVEVRIPFKDLRWLGGALSLGDSPAGKPGQSPSGGPAKVIFESAGESHTWDGYLARIKAEVDRKTRTLPLVIEVPLDNSTSRPTSSYPLTPGMFVTVELTGKKIDKAYLLPRSAIHPGDLVYLADNNRLVIRPVEVIRRLNDSVYVGKGLKDGDTVIITPVSAPKEGMRLKVRREGGKEARGPGGKQGAWGQVCS